LGHVERPQVARLLRAAEALVLPSRYRVPFDDAVVDLARRAGRPVVTTHGGPAHLIRHEETGIITYDNPGSMVWALDRILGDQMIRNTRWVAHSFCLLTRGARLGCQSIALDRWALVLARLLSPRIERRTAEISSWILPCLELPFCDRGCRSISASEE